MRRRQFIAFGASAAALWPIAARAQQKLPVVAILNAGSAASTAPYMQGFRDGMAELGYDHGRNVQFHFRFGDGELDRLPSLAAELVALAPSVIVTAPLPANLAVARLTTSIPIVLASGADPVGFGLVRSLAHPGGNVTGVSNFSEGLPSKQFDVLTQLLPQLAKPAILLNTTNKLHEPQERAAAAAASQSGHNLLLARVGNADAVTEAFSFLTSEQADG